MKRLPRPAAILLALLIAALCAWCLTTRPPPIRVAKKGGYTDVHLYHDITNAVVAGKPYHQAAAELQRTHHYPLKPFFTVRPPTLVILAATFGWTGVRVIGGIVLAIGAAAWFMAMAEHFHWAERGSSTLLIFAGAGNAVASPVLLGLHEYLAGMFMAVALAGVFGWPRKWWWILLPAALGLAVRELVLPFVLLALAFAVIDRRWREAAAWAGLVALFATLMAVHAHEVAQQLRPGDITSPGWHAAQGFSAFLKAVIFTSILGPLPLPLALLVSMLPLVGWMALEGRAGLFAQIMVAGYVVLISAFSRADTFYWGAIMLPWYFLGYALLPRAIWQLAQAIRGNGTATGATPLPA